MDGFCPELFSDAKDRLHLGSISYAIRGTNAVQKTTKQAEQSDHGSGKSSVESSVKTSVKIKEMMQSNPFGRVKVNRDRFRGDTEKQPATIRVQVGCNRMRWRVPAAFAGRSPYTVRPLKPIRSAGAYFVR